MFYAYEILKKYKTEQYFDEPNIYHNWHVIYLLKNQDDSITEKFEVNEENRHIVTSKKFIGLPDAERHYNGLVEKVQKYFKDKTMGKKENIPIEIITKND